MKFASDSLELSYIELMLKKFHSIQIESLELVQKLSSVEAALPRHCHQCPLNVGIPTNW
ncbi:hypothetical protein LEP1GSC137_3799 [Leptospira borgpetersenii str. Noumea 25]|uniref:Uncharacterized protein n=1 Tax=Leptospira borgpetersenii serovar Ballum TaxID=280505 RepID=A0A0S2IT41_LEPBO|nr:hypothetical protein LBBP_02603 [Leptospira borgpetersenii serovar Ballum]EKR01400.1 hypothetical protein LEP1GSC121_2815 [Leptospira borgpetersenii serovar Castellonis str. 200801910]EMO10801.1 hypothetical protein LEP1GSC137_3799 [Leptospira borgpetersenii str. Noumea 25]